MAVGMRAGTAKRIEKNVDRAAAAALAASAGFAAFALLQALLAEPVLGAVTGGVGAIIYLFGVRALRAVGPRERFRVAVFDVSQIEPMDPPELLLTDRYEPVADIAQDPLVLDDILAELGPDSRVVRLFDPAAMPTPGQLDDHIQRHLVSAAPAATPPDASQVLREALAELRQSLR